MAKVSTIYDVRVKFNLDHRAASKGLTAFNKKIKAVSKSFTAMNKKTSATSKNMTTLGRSGGKAMRTIDRQARRASSSLDKVSRKAKTASKGMRGSAGAGGGGSGIVGKAVGAAAGFFGGQALLKHTVGYNRELDNTKKSLATVIQMMDKSTDTREKGLAKSSMLMSQLREDAKSSAGTFQDMTGFSQEIAAAVLKAGGSMSDLRDMTKGGVIAASALGERSDVAALDIKQALGKGVSKRDPFASKLLASIDVTTEAFNKLDTASRLKTLQKAFNQPAIKAAAKEYQTSFEGVFSTFKSTLQEFGGKVGSKLFATLTKELQKVNKWFTQNSKNVDDFADKLATGMVTAFEAAKSIFGFLNEHKDLLMTMAKAFLITKGAGVLAGPFLSFNQKLSGSEGKLGKFGGAVGAAGSLLQSFGAGFAIGTVFDDLTGASGKLSTAFDKLMHGANAAGSGVNFSTKGIDTSTVEGRAKVKEMKAAAIRSKFEERLAKARKAQSPVERYMPKAQREALAKQREAQVRKKYSVDQREASGLESSAKAMIMTKNLERVLGTQETKRVEEARMKVISQGIVKFMADLTPAGMGANPFLGSPNFSMLDPNSTYNAPMASESTTKDKKNNVRIGKIVMQIESNDPDRLALGMEGLFSDLAKNGSQATNALYEGK